MRAAKRSRARYAAGLFDELVVDNFAGGGGASIGIERALGRAVDLAVNHSPAAVAMHKANHPHTLHHCEDVWSIDPMKATSGRPVGLAWFSPDCKHFSHAKGGKPVEKKIRGLAWVVVNWAKLVRPRAIMLENVREFQDWGPLGEDNRPILAERGTIFREWIEALKSFGYRVEWRELVAADFGAPTTRKRLFLIARSDGLPIAWPEPTHGPGRKPYRTASQCIDWSLPCPSIFLSKEEARPMRIIRPLAEKTMRRIAMGVKRFVIDSPKPFIVGCNHGGDHFRGQPVDRPLATVTGRHGYGLVAPMIAHYYGEHTHQETRGQRADEPLRTVTAENRFGLVTAFLAKHYGGVVGHGVERPIGTVTGIDHHSVVAAFLSTHYGDRPDGSSHTGHSLAEPHPTVTARATQHQLAAANLIKMNFGDKQWMPCEEPLRTILAGANHHGLVMSFLSKYYGRSCGQSPADPLATITSGEKFGVVTVAGQPFAIADIGLRMLRPRELFRAQGFPEDYRIEVELNGKRLSREAQVHACGNSVCPPVAEAIVRANFMAQDEWEAA